jgi:hypothetical protein
MKTVLVLALLGISTQVFASTTELNVPVQMNGVAVRILADGMEADDEITVITNPRLKVNRFGFSIPLERNEKSGDALCAALNKDRPFSFLNEIGVANDSVISALNDKNVATLELVNETLVATATPVTSGRWIYTYKSLGCSRTRMHSEGQ